VWTQDASGPLRGGHDLERQPTTKHVSGSVPTVEPEPARRRSIWPWLLLLALVGGAAAYYQREWVVDRWLVASATIQDLAEPDLAGAETGSGDESAGSDSIIATGAPADATDESESDTGEATTQASEAETGASETDTDEFGDTAPTETEDDTFGGELVTDRPAPPGTFRAGSYITPNEPGPSGDQPAARRYCEDLAAARFAGVSKWRLANPSELGNFIGTKIKKARYWSSAVWQGKARVYSLPGGKKDSEKVEKKIARPLCVARW
jgi:hypothetical protein